MHEYVMVLVPGEGDIEELVHDVLAPHKGDWLSAEGTPDGWWDYYTINGCTWSRAYGGDYVLSVARVCEAIRTTKECRPGRLVGGDIHIESEHGTWRDELSDYDMAVLDALQSAPQGSRVVIVDCHS